MEVAPAARQDQRLAQVEASQFTVATEVLRPASTILPPGRTSRLSPRTWAGVATCCKTRSAHPSSDTA